MSHVVRAACAAISIAAFVLIASPTAGQPELSSVALPAELDRVLRDYEQAWSHGDAAALARLFADDGFVLSPGRAMVRGKAAIEEAYRGSGGGALALRAVAFAREGKVGYIIGAYAEHTGDPDRGKFTLTLHRDASGRWLIFSDMDNGNEPRH